MKTNIFGIIAIIGIILFGVGVAKSPDWVKLLFFGAVITYIGAFCLETFCTEEEIIGKNNE